MFGRGGRAGAGPFSGIGPCTTTGTPQQLFRPRLPCVTPSRPDPGLIGAPHARQARRAASVVCAVEALALVGICCFYGWEIARGASDDTTRAVMSTLLIAVFAVGIALLSVGWWGSATWVGTPTVVWNVLLLPVAWSLAQSGQEAAGAAVGVAGVAGIVSAVAARAPDRA